MPRHTQAERNKRLAKQFGKAGVKPTTAQAANRKKADRTPQAAPKTKPKGRAGRKTLGEASASARRRGTSTSRRLEKPLTFVEAKRKGKTRIGETKQEFATRMARRKN